MVGLPRVREPVLTGRQLQAWLSLLEHRTGVRVAPEREAYVRSVLEKRMSECGIQRADGYLARLARESDVEGGEWEVLLDRVLIGETSFFRHQPSFDFLSRLVATRLAAGGEPAPLTFWSVGCSTGEEAYSLAMVLTAAFRKAGCHPAFGVIATDLNRRSLEVAREGVYPPRALRGVDPAVVDEYFEPLPSGKRRIKAFLRRHVLSRQYAGSGVLLHRARTGRGLLPEPADLLAPLAPPCPGATTGRHLAAGGRAGGGARGSVGLDAAGTVETRGPQRPGLSAGRLTRRESTLESQRTTSRVDWVAGEVAISLAHAGDELQAFLNDPADIARLRVCRDYIHQVRGSLEVAGAAGACRLTSEAETLLDAMMAPDGVLRREEALEVLAQALGEIPAYLDQVVASGREDPLGLQVLISDLRAVRGDFPVLDDELFQPDLSPLERAGGTRRGPPSAELCKKLSGSYQQALLGLLREEAVSEHCRTIERVFSRLRELHRGTQRENLWWVASAFAEGLFYHHIPLSSSTRQLLRELEREIRRLAGGEWSCVLAPASRSLLINLLFHVGRTGADTPRIRSVALAFGLDELPVPEGRNGAGHGKRVHDGETVRGISEGLHQEIDAIKELVEEIVARPEASGSLLERAMVPVGRIVAILQVVEHPLLEQRIAALEDSLRHLAARDASPTDEETRRLAELVVELESAVGAWGVDRLRDRSAPDLPDDQRLEVNKAWRVLISEMRAGLDAVKSRITDFLSADGGSAGLEFVPAQTAGVAGAMRLVGLDVAARRLDTCAHFVESRLQSGERISTADLDALAEVLSAVEQYLDDMKAGAGEGDTASLGRADAAHSELARFGRNPITLPDTEEPSDEADAMKPTKEQPQAGNPGNSPASGSDIDPEIREIFVEEAREVLDTLNESFPPWRDDSDAEALATTRRAFHTLKGSGRMVGAGDVGELAWAVENLLNRVIDGREPGDATVKQCVADTLALVPAMVAAFEAGNGDYDHSEAQRLETLAHQLASGERPEEGEAAPPPSQPGESAGAGEEREEIDPALVEIFTGEARTHFDTVQEFVDAQRAKAPFYDQPTSRLQAALHTLKGSAHMASIDPIAELVTPLERLIKEMLNFQLAVDEDVVELLADVRTYCLEAIVALERGEPCKTEEQAMLVARVAELRERSLGPVLGQEAAEGRGADPALLNLLMADGMRMVFDAESHLAQGMDAAQCATMADELAQLREGAERGGMPAMARLCDHLAAAWKNINDGGALPSSTRDTLLGAHEQLLDMADAVAADQDIPEPETSLLERLDAIAAEDALPEQEGPGTDVPAQEEGGAETVVPEDVDAEVVDLFLGEADELLEGIEEAFEDWRQAPGESEHPDELKRLLHTFKGGARMAGLESLGELSHELESRVMETEPRVAEGDTAPLSDLLAHHDQLVAGIAAVRGRLRGTSVPEPETPAREPEPTPPAWDSAEILPFTGTYKGLDPGTQTDARESQEAAQEMVRVSAQMLDELVNLAGETSISRSQVEQNISEFMFSLDEMEATIRRMHDQVRRLAIETDAQVTFRREQIEASDTQEGFDPLEMDRYSQLQQLSRSLLESGSDLQDLRDTLVDKSRDAESLLLQQSRINTDLQEGLMRTRMVPFSRLVPRLRRVVRQVSGAVGKEIKLNLGNVEGELDRTVLDRIVSPLEHMIRNAIDHGVESPEERESAGKPAKGSLSLSFAREGGDVLIRIADDGRGLNIEAIREKAYSQGLINEEVHYSDNEIAQFIFHPGFSTSAEVTQTSGRGVGMDVVNSEVRQLGGSVNLTTRAGAGTEFQVRLPFTVSVNRALMIELGEDSYALALNSISGVTRLSQDDLMYYYQHPEDKLEYAGEFYEVRYLGTLLSRELRPNLDTALGQVPLVLIRGEEHNFAVQVDALIGSREVVVKTLGSHFSRVPGLSGATVLGDGRVVVILDLQNLLRDQAATTVLTPTFDTPTRKESEEEGPSVQTIMVVDDSVTVRKVTGRFLEREGFRVITARDGVDAMRTLQDNTPDLMLLDIEMPRMDGFEVTRLVRSTQRLKDLPIIMITSRTGEKHRERALSMGVNSYLGKPYQEEVLIQEVYHLLTSMETG